MVSELIDSKKKSYRNRRDVLSFLEEDDSFYEGAYLATTKWSPRKERWYHLFPLWILNYGYVYNIRKYVPKGATVLELGCGGGINYLNDRYQMIGLDLSFASLQKTPYPLKLQASATDIPLKDHSVDAVVSSFFWEHIDKSTKYLILEECKRVLKPGGKLIFFYDVETNNPLIRKLKNKDIKLYNQLFLEKDGHIGYHTPKENQLIFESAGFQKIKHFGMERTRLLRVSELEKLHRGGVVSKYHFRIVQKIQGSPLKYFYEYCMMITNYLFSRILPESSSRVIVSVFSISFPRK